MAFFDKLNEVAKTVSDKTNVALESTKEAIEVTKLTNRIGSEKTAIGSVEKQIGKLCYDKYAEGEPVSADIAELCALIDKHNRAIKELEDEIARYKGVPVTSTQQEMAAEPVQASRGCPNCGAVCGEGTRFCGECGTAL